MRTDMVKCWACGGTRPERGPCPTCKPAQGELERALAENEKLRADTHRRDFLRRVNIGTELERAARGEPFTPAETVEAVRPRPAKDAAAELLELARRQTVPDHNYVASARPISISAGGGAHLEAHALMPCRLVGLELVGLPDVVLETLRAGTRLVYDRAVIPFGRVLRLTEPFPCVQPGIPLWMDVQNRGPAPCTVHVIGYCRLLA